MSRALVFHTGAIGDSVLIWPLLRALTREQSASVTLVTHAAKASLAASNIAGLVAVDIESARFSTLWSGEIATPDPSVTHLYTFITDDTTESGRRWLVAAQASFPRAHIECIGPPGSVSRTTIWQHHRVTALGAVPPRHNPGGPVILHVGAGSRDKRWPMTYWAALAAALPTPVQLLAGEVEHEQFTSAERSTFTALGGEFLTTLPDLAKHLRAARLVICADSGPAHLSAQLGIPTLTLFGPTDLRIWSPVGPQVTTIAPPNPSPMTWLEPQHVLIRARLVLAARREPAAVDKADERHDG